MLRIGADLRLMAAPILTAKEPGFDDRLERVLAALPDTKVIWSTPGRSPR
jgi:hypothetical protein